MSPAYEAHSADCEACIAATRIVSAAREGAREDQWRPHMAVPITMETMLDEGKEMVASNLTRCERRLVNQLAELLSRAYDAGYHAAKNR